MPSRARLNQDAAPFRQHNTWFQPRQVDFFSVEDAQHVRYEEDQ
jgi:hypothetical protein